MAMDDEKSSLLANFKSYIESLDPKLFGVDSLNDVSLTPITSGHQNFNCVVTLNNQDDHKFIIRYDPQPFDEFAGTKNEYENLLSLDGFYAPKVLFLGKPDFLGQEVLIMEFLEGVHKEFTSLTTEEIAALAKVVSDINNRTKSQFSRAPGGPPDNNGTYLDYLRGMIESTIDRRLNAADPSVYEKGKEVIPEVREKLEKMIKENQEAFSGNVFSMLHLDIIPPNVLWKDEKVTFIDWSALSYGDRADEVAFIFAINNMGADFRKKFLQQYLNHVNDPTLAQRIEVYILKLLLFDFAWSITMLDEEAKGKHGVMAKEKGLYKSFYDVRLKSLKECLR